MTADDKLGIGAGLLALGLASGMICLAQVLPENVLPWLPHREAIRAEAVFDAVLFVLGTFPGAYLFYRGVKATDSPAP